MKKLLIHTFGKLKLDKDGTWFHDDSPFIHEGMSKLFHKSIIQLVDQSYALKIDNSEAPIEVEDVILWVTDLLIDAGNSSLSLVLSNDEIIKVEQSMQFEIANQDQLYCYQDSRKIKFTRKAYNFLTPYFIEDKSKYFLQIGQLKLTVNQLT